jgi:hypothetical protein
MCRVVSLAPNTQAAEKLVISYGRYSLAWLAQVAIPAAQTPSRMVLPHIGVLRPPLHKAVVLEEEEELISFYIIIFKNYPRNRQWRPIWL